MSHMALTNSSPWATERACQRSSSVADSSPYRRLLATVPEKRKAFCGTKPMCLQRSARFNLRMSLPSMSSRPSQTS